MVTLIVTVVVSAWAALATFATVKLSRRLLEFDVLFEMLSHDLITNVKYFDSISEHSLLSNVEEVVTADRNMRIMHARLDEYITRVEELTRRKLRKPKQVPNPPVVR